MIFYLKRNYALLGELEDSTRLAESVTLDEGAISSRRCCLARWFDMRVIMSPMITGNVTSPPALLPAPDLLLPPPRPPDNSEVNKEGKASASMDVPPPEEAGTTGCWLEEDGGGGGGGGKNGWGPDETDKRDCGCCGGICRCWSSNGGGWS